MIDASKMGSVARLINHSCGPNCHTEYWKVGAETRVGIYATRLPPPCLPRLPPPPSLNPACVCGFLMPRCGWQRRSRREPR